MGATADWRVVRKKGERSYFRAEKRWVVAQTDHYHVTIKSKGVEPEFRPERPGKWKERWRHYRGLVYCATVRNQTLYVRRNGKASWCGNTGYSKVAKNLGVMMAKDGNKVVFGSFQYGGAPVDIDLDGARVTMAEAGNGVSMKRLIENEKADVVVHIRDNFVLSALSPVAYDVYSFCRNANSKLICYSPVDSTPIQDPVFDVAMNRCDFNLTMTKWGMDALFEAGIPAEKVDFLYHGIDTSLYKKRDRSECKRILGFPDKPLIGYVSANIDLRKMLPMAMIVFKKVLEKIPDANLCMWTMARNFWDLIAWRDDLGLEGKVFFPQSSMTWGVTEERMAVVHSAFDVNLHVPLAEGFSLPLIESKAAGTPIVCTDLPVLREILGDWPDYIRSFRNFPLPSGLIQWTIDPEDAEEKVVNSFNDTRDAPDMSGFAWSAVYGKFKAIVEKVA